MDRSGNIECSSTLIFSKCGGYLITSIPISRYNRARADFRILAHDLSSRKSFATSIKVNRCRKKTGISVQSREHYVYISGYTGEGQVFARRWDLQNPAIIEVLYLGYIPESYVRSSLYNHTILLFSQHRIRAVLLTSDDWEDPSRRYYSRSQSGLLLSQESGWNEDWKTLQASLFMFEGELWNYHLLGNLPFRTFESGAQHSAESPDFRTRRYAKALKEHETNFLNPEEEISLAECHAREGKTRIMLGEGPWVEPRFETFLHCAQADQGMYHHWEKYYRLFRWTMDYYRETTVLRMRGLSDGVVGPR